MNGYRYAGLSIIRRPAKSIILCCIFTLIFLGQLVGITIYSIAKKGEADAFNYRGSALLIGGENLNLTEELYKEIKEMDHIKGVNNWKETIAYPVDMENIKEYSGETPGEATDGSGWKSDCVVLLAEMDTSLYKWFRWEKSVSLVEGAYPSEENQGILIESRFAEKNNLSVGDKASFTIDETEKECEFVICGIFKVDSEFIITDKNESGEGVFIHSPYNVIFIDYEYAANTIGFESQERYGCEVFVDQYENVDKVAYELWELLGSEADIYNTAANYLGNQAGIVVLMKNYSYLILFYISVIGAIIMLLILTFYAIDYRHESGIYLALGYKKIQVLLRYMIATGGLLVVSFIMASMIFAGTSGKVVDYIQQEAEQVVSKENTQQTDSPYETPQLGQAFSLTIDKTELITPSAYGKIFAMAIGCFLTAMMIPFYTILTTKPKYLLNTK